MTEDDFEILLNKLNENKIDRLIQLKPISEFVDYAKVWDAMPKPCDKICLNEVLKQPHNYYLMKNSDGVYVSVVFDMENDLHIFTLEEHRNEGNLTAALNEVVLNHLFLYKDEVKITIDKNYHTEKSFIIAEKIALKLGFVKQAETNPKLEYLLSKADFKSYKQITDYYPCMDEKRMNELLKEINYLSKYLHLIQTEIEMKMADADFITKMEYVKDQLSELTNDFEEAWWINESLKHKNVL